MSTSSPNSVPAVARSLAPSSNGQTKPTGLVPTNNVTTKDGVTVRARIDPTLTVDDVVRQLCINLKINEPPANYALRDETDDLVTNDNLRKKIKMKIPLKYATPHFISLPLSLSCTIFRLVSAPEREAREIADRLGMRDDKTLRLTLFSLQRYIRVLFFWFLTLCQ